MANVEAFQKKNKNLHKYIIKEMMIFEETNTEVRLCLA